MTDVPSEKVQAKAAEYLLSGRVKVEHMVRAELGGPGDHFEAHVTPPDGGDPYIVKFNLAGWHCDCLARVQVCAHVLACQTITDLSTVPVERPSFVRDKSIDDLLNGV